MPAKGRERWEWRTPKNSGRGDWPSFSPVNTLITTDSCIPESSLPPPVKPYDIYITRPSFILPDGLDPRIDARTLGPTKKSE